MSRVEYTFGTPKTIAIYLVSAIGGNIFSAVCQPFNIKAGASTSLYGLLGLLIAYLILNWDGLDLIGPIMKCQLVCITIMLLVFILVFTSVSGVENIDYFGHLGGFLTGMWMCSIH